MKYSFSWQEPFVLAFSSWIHEFPKNQSRLGCDMQICDLKLSFSWEIYFIVSDADHELDFCDWIPNERNEMQTLTCSLTIPGIFLVKTL